MGTISEKLTYLNNTKTAIADAIAAKGVSVTGKTFRQYADAIGDIETGGGGGEIVSDDPYLIKTDSTGDLYGGHYDKITVNLIVTSSRYTLNRQLNYCMIDELTIDCSIMAESNQLSFDSSFSTYLTDVRVKKLVIKNFVISKVNPTSSYPYSILTPFFGTSWQTSEIVFENANWDTYFNNARINGYNRNIYFNNLPTYAVNNPDSYICKLTDFPVGMTGLTSSYSFKMGSYALEIYNPVFKDGIMSDYFLSNARWIRFRLDEIVDKYGDIVYSFDFNKSFPYWGNSNLAVGSNIKTEVTESDNYYNLYNKLYNVIGMTPLETMVDSLVTHINTTPLTKNPIMKFHSNMKTVIQNAGIDTALQEKGWIISFTS